MDGRRPEGCRDHRAGPHPGESDAGADREAVVVYSTTNMIAEQVTSPATSADCR